MTDFLDKPLNFGDDVIYLSHSRTSSHYVKAKIINLTPKRVTIVTSDKSVKNVEAYKLIRITERIE